ncbi:MAG: helix-turn-helix domain-containing protein [Chitinophagales bacterium]
MAEIIVIGKGELEKLIRNSITDIFKEKVEKEIRPRVDIFSLQEAANYLHLAPQTLYGLTSKRKIPFIKKGKKLYFKVTDLEKWLEDGRKKSKSEIEDELEQE